MASRLLPVLLVVLFAAIVSADVVTLTDDTFTDKVGNASAPLAASGSHGKLLTVGGKVAVESWMRNRGREMDLEDEWFFFNCQAPCGCSFGGFDLHPLCFRLCPSICVGTGWFSATQMRHAGQRSAGGANM